MSRKKELNRRNFIKASAAGIVGTGILAQAPIMAAIEEKKAKPVKIKEYRVLGRTGFKASDIGAGGVTPVGVMNALLDAGLNYIDSAESYGRGQSEKNIGEAIQGRDRKKIFITTKLGFKKDKPETKEMIVERFQKCLKRLSTDYVDCLMIHSAPTPEALKNKAFHAAAKQLKAEGKLRFVGVSNHGGHYGDVPASMEEILLAAVEDGRFDLFLLVYNFLQYEQAENVMKACKKKNIGVTLMKTNPVGKYYGMQERIETMKKEGKKVPDFYKTYTVRLKTQVDKAEAFIKKYNLQNPKEISAAAYRFVLSNPNVSTVNIAFRNFDSIDKTLQLSGSRLTQKDKKTLAVYERGCSQLYCRHACGICEDNCPEGVPVNTIMRYSHYFDAQGREKEAMTKYAALNSKKADQCEDCSGGCEAKCPYGVPIQGLLVQAHNLLTLS